MSGKEYAILVLDWEAEEPESRLDEFPVILPRVVACPARLPRALVNGEEVAFHRNLECEQYSECLSQARLWPGFSCRGCPRFHPSRNRW
ncbi:MAG: hypothetical protein GMKNLPBB_03370 [Myxococcota bacterium]|nr:hypothetical protein [Myxococcota bacterium]